VPLFLWVIPFPFFGSDTALATSLLGCITKVTLIVATHTWAGWKGARCEWVRSFPVQFCAWGIRRAGGSPKAKLVNSGKRKEKRLGLVGPLSLLSPLLLWTQEKATLSMHRVRHSHALVRETLSLFSQVCFSSKANCNFNHAIPLSPTLQWLSLLFSQPTVPVQSPLLIKGWRWCRNTVGSPLNDSTSSCHQCTGRMSTSIQWFIKTG